MSSYELESTWFGRKVNIEYSASTVSYATVGLRLVMGWIFFQAGLIKLVDPTWSSARFLTQDIPRGNPFAGAWTALAGNAAVDFLVMWGMTLIGLCLLVGALVRWSAFWGALLMLLFWAAHLQGGLGMGLPIEYGWIVDEHLVYALLLFGLGALGAGRIYGVDAFIEETPLIVRQPWLKLLLG
jgi:thiosulfate dehydrogenase [quinone] large subunit